MGVPVMRNAEEFRFDGDNVGCLLIHGFTGSPAEMRPMGEALAQKGYTIYGVRLAGHGTSMDEMARTGRQDWLGSARSALHEMKHRCEHVFVMGLSMGGTISLRLAAEEDVAGVVSLAGAVKLITGHTVSSFLHGLVQGGKAAPPWQTEQDHLPAVAYDRYPVGGMAQLTMLVRETRACLRDVTAPILIAQGRLDPLLDPANADYIYEHVGSKQKRIMWLDRSGHLLPLDKQRRELFEEVIRFVEQNTGEASK